MALNCAGAGAGDMAQLLAIRFGRGSGKAVHATPDFSKCFDCHVYSHSLGDGRVETTLACLLGICSYIRFTGNKFPVL